jgi:hypothetical protein
MIKLLIKQGPFYIASFTTLFLALDNTGWLDRWFPEANMAPISEALFMTSGPVSGPLVENESNLPLWMALVALVVVGLLLGWIFSRVWRFIVR